jgi:hypothetical protein
MRMPTIRCILGALLCAAVLLVMAQTPAEAYWRVKDRTLTEGGSPDTGWISVWAKATWIGQKRFTSSPKKAVAEVQRWWAWDGDDQPIDAEVGIGGEATLICHLELEQLLLPGEQPTPRPDTWLQRCWNYARATADIYPAWSYQKGLVGGSWRAIWSFDGYAAPQNKNPWGLSKTRSTLGTERQWSHDVSVSGDWAYLPWQSLKAARCYAHVKIDGTVTWGQVHAVATCTSSEWGEQYAT